MTDLAAEFDFTSFDMWWDDMRQDFQDGMFLVYKSNAVCKSVEAVTV